MSPWAESLGVLLLAAGGVLLGVWFSRFPRRWWLPGYLIPLVLILLCVLACRYPILTVIRPISWVTAGRSKFAVTGLLGALILTTPLRKLPKRRDRIAVSLLMVFVVFLTSVWPFLAPAFNRDRLAGLTTRIDGDGICLQNTDYTCGPAAAVTALRRLGFKADEGKIAILAHTSCAGGTLPDVLAEVLQKNYAKDGLACEYRVFKSVSELRTNTPALAVVRFNIILDHYVTVLSVSDDEVVVGDPLLGLNKLTPAEFGAKWRFVGVVLKRK